MIITKDCIPIKFIQAEIKMGNVKLILNVTKIEYHIRIRDNFWVLNPKTGKQFKATWLFSDFKLNETKFLHSIYYDNNQLCYLSASKIKNKEGNPEFQIFFSFCKPEIAQKIYKERWQIETA